MAPFASAVASHLQKADADPIEVTVYVQADSNIVMDGERVGRLVTPAVTKEIERSKTTKNRLGGRIVYGDTNI